MKIFISVTLGLFLAALLPAAPITYSVMVNTASLSGSHGSLDFNFNPGPFATQAAMLAIQSFRGDGTPLGSPPTIGDVSGALPSFLSFDNGAAFNDYFQGFTYGSTLSFDVNLSGPALSAPDGASTSGSTFAFSMFSDVAGKTPALTSDTRDGFAFLINVNLDGTTTVTDYSTQTTITVGAGPASTVPEPGTVALLSTATLLVFVGRRIVARFAPARR